MGPEKGGRERGGREGGRERVTKSDPLISTLFFCAPQWMYIY